MSSAAIEFAFGGSGKNLEDIKGAYSGLCAEAAAWLKNTPPSTSGHGWLGLPDIDTAEIKEAAEWLRGYDVIIHVGIGGSALGSLMLNQALLDEYYNETENKPKFYLADNPDPTKTRAIWERAKGSRVALIGVSKSGATAETMSQFLWFCGMMAQKDSDYAKNVLVITDPENGIFRAFAEETGCRALPLPPSVGGRYSVLCAAGLVSAAALGIDIDALLRGAREMRAALLEKNTIEANPAWFTAALHCAHAEAGRPMAVLMPYSSKLESFAEWFAQLWGESLGKEGKGTTPVRAVGAIDQHSQVQLYTEGPDDKLFTLINIKKHGDETFVPPVAGDALAPLSYLNGAETGEMLGLEAMSTAAALVKAGRPVIWMEIGKIDAAHIGSLVFYFEYLTAMTGRMTGINPFDQPGVEQGKRYTYGLMGRDGYEKDAEEAKEWFASLKVVYTPR